MTQKGLRQDVAGALFIGRRQIYVIARFRRDGTLDHPSLLWKPSVNHCHRKVLHGLFPHPISANLSVPGAESMFEEFGAELTHGHSRKLSAHLGRHKENFSTTHHKLPKEEVIQVHKSLET